jgi:hypothetical protein
MRINHKVIALLLVAVLVGIFSAYTVYTQWYVQGVERYNVNFTVTESPVLGFALGSGDKNDTFIFGKISIGGGADRRATVVSDSTVIGRVSFDGDTAPYLSVMPSCFQLVAGQPQDLVFSAKVPSPTPTGDYYGAVRVVYTRPLPWNKC